MTKKLEKRILNLCKEQAEEISDDVPKDINEFEDYPHIFVLGAIMDRQIPAEKAWEIPRKVAKDLEGKDFSLFAEKDQEYYYKIFEKSPEGKKLHRFPKIMAECFYKGIQTIKNEYNTDASNIWNDNPSKIEIIKRFEEFEGIGQKISTMATNILYREYNIIDKNDLGSIDISPDTHVIKVFKRMGFVPKEDKRLVIEKAREINPEYPGILDYIIYRHGQEVCKKRDPLCDECKFSDICPKILL